MDIFYVKSDGFLENPPKNFEEDFLDVYGKSYKNEKKRAEHAIGRFIAKTVAEKFYHIKNTEIDIENSKPYFTNSDLQFSISHSKNIVLVGFDRSPIGVDVEFMKERDVKTIAERMNINLETADLETFYRYWTTYEADIKLQGEMKSSCTFKLLPDYMLTIFSEKSFDIKTMLKIYELKNFHLKTSEMINLKLKNSNIPNQNTVEIKEIKTSSLEFFEPFVLTNL